MILTFSILLLLTATSCFTPLLLNKEFYNNKKVGVILYVNKIEFDRIGSQGILDRALTSGKRFKNPLEIMESNINFRDSLEKEITNILKSNKKQFLFIPDVVDIDSFNNFEKPDFKMKYFKKDLSALKNRYNIDEILYVEASYGILVSYYGYMETGRQGFASIDTKIIDLNNNGLLQQEYIKGKVEIEGKWNQGKDYENLQNAIQEAIQESIKNLNTKF